MKRARANGESAVGTNMTTETQPGHAHASGISFTSPSAALTIDKDAYGSQLAAKLLKLKALFSDLAMPEVDVRTSEPEHYRMRAEFNVWGSREGERLHYIMYSTDPAAPPKEGESTLQRREDADDQSGQQPSSRADDAVDAEEDPAASKADRAEASAGESGASSIRSSTDPSAEAAPSGKGGGGGSWKRGKRQRQSKPRAPRVEISSFPVGSRLINEMMPVVLEACNKDPLLKLGLFQV